MTLVTSNVRPGQWVKVALDEAPTGVAPIAMGIGDDEAPAFVEGSFLMRRCPQAERGSLLPVTVDGVSIGQVYVT